MSKKWVNDAAGRLIPEKIKQHIDNLKSFAAASSINGIANPKDPAEKEIEMWETLSSGITGRFLDVEERDGRHYLGSQRLEEAIYQMGKKSGKNFSKRGVYRAVARLGKVKKNTFGSSSTTTSYSKSRSSIYSGYYSKPEIQTRPIPIFELQNKSPSDIFKSLTIGQTLCSYGSEEKMFGPLLTKLGFEWLKDVETFTDLILNPDGSLPTTAWSAHLDNVIVGGGEIAYEIPANTVIQSSNGGNIGADDRAGVSILLYLHHHKVPGLYLMFAGEESGGIGSEKYAEKYKDDLDGIKRIIAFDRRDYYSVITHQGSRTASDGFAEEVATLLNKHGAVRQVIYTDGKSEETKYRKDNSGTFTDTKNFSKIIPECTNISVGYKNEHSSQESLDLYFLDLLGFACLKIDWEQLPTLRSPEKDNEYAYKFSSSYSSPKWTGGNDYYGYDEDDMLDWPAVGKSSQKELKLAKKGSKKSFGAKILGLEYIDQSLKQSFVNPDKFETIYDFCRSDPYKAALLIEAFYMATTNDDDLENIHLYVERELME